MSKVLHVWTDGGSGRPARAVGRFVKDDAGVVRFHYSPEAALPISASLPLDGTQSATAARNFLENLLPENPTDRALMRINLGARGLDSFDLLDSVDTAGGLCFTYDERMPDFEPTALVPFGPLDIEARIVAAERGSGLDAPSRPIRFSLAGYQNKFTLSYIEGFWYRPSATIPSTHIVKPNPSSLPHVVEAENAIMDLADACGVPASRHGILEAGQSRAYCVERFDRAGIGTAACSRIHVEDLAQALGLPPEDKYDATVEDAVFVLKRIDASCELCYAWLRQYMFNAYAGNSDGHLKNYSIIYGQDGPSIAPLYDAVPTSAWQLFDRNLGLSLNDTVHFPEYLTADVWKQLATHCGLDSQRVVGMAQELAFNIRQKLPQFVETLPPAMQEAACDACIKATNGILGYDPSIDERIAPLYEDDAIGTASLKASAKAVMEHRQSMSPSARTFTPPSRFSR